MSKMYDTSNKKQNKNKEMEVSKMRDALDRTAKNWNSAKCVILRIEN